MGAEVADAEGVRVVDGVVDVDVDVDGVGVGVGFVVGAVSGATCGPHLPVPSWLFKVIKKIKAEKLLLLFHYCLLKGGVRSGLSGGQSTLFTH